ncbi:hypothetical protein MTO96_007306 [Rhipicephalus appendiculatus]
MAAPVGSRTSGQWQQPARQINGGGGKERAGESGAASGGRGRDSAPAFLFSHRRRRRSHAVSRLRRHHRRDERGTVVATAGTKGVDEERKKRCKPDREERTEARGWAGLAPRGGERACVCAQLQRRRGQQPRRPDLGALDAFPEDDGGGGPNGLK